MNQKITLNNILKITMALAFLVISFSVFYYFVIFVPTKEMAELELQEEQQRQKQLTEELASQIKNEQICREAGKRAYEDYESGKPAKWVDAFLEPEFKFNKCLNTCIYSGGHTSGDYVESFVKNTFTNKDIIWTFDKRGEYDEKYQRQHDMLFNDWDNCEHWRTIYSLIK